MKAFIVFCLIFSSTQAFQFEDLILAEQWTSFKANYNKTYESTLEEIHRMEVFLNNTKKIAEHNALFEKGEVTYTLGVNQFADLTPEEFVETITCLMNIPEEDDENASEFLPPLNFEAPRSVDWRPHGWVTGVKNQGRCGSCWSFATTGVLEGQIRRRRGHLPSLSEQNLVDCCRDRYGSHGCHGGFMNGAYRYIKDNRGIDTEQGYPYQGIDGRCRYSPRARGGTVSSYRTIPRGNENVLRDAVASQGPIAVAIYVGHAFQFYHRGVFYDGSCRGKQINHAVLIVGYGFERNQPYWLVKNSWGPGWGDGGYIKMARNRGNNCQIASYGSFPIP